MGFAFVTAAAVGLWLILWALGIKGFDGGLLALLIVTIAGSVRYLGNFLPKKQ